MPRETVPNVKPTWDLLMSGCAVQTFSVIGTIAAHQKKINMNFLKLVKLLFSYSISLPLPFLHLTECVTRFMCISPTVYLF